MTENQDSSQKALNDVLIELSKSLHDEKDILADVDKFKEIYTEGFRHFYSPFFALITRIVDEKGSTGLETLLENLQLIQQQISVNSDTDKSFTKTSEAIDKVYDHLNLEVSRWNLYAASQSELGSIKSQITKTEQALQDAVQNLEKAEKKAASLQTEIITVLSIFSAIVIATVGSFSYISSALAGMQNTHIFKSSIIVLISGILIFNTIALLMYLIAKITGRSIYAECKTPDCTCANKRGRIKCWGITRIRRRLPYIYWFNILFIVLMIIDTVLWYYSYGFPMYYWKFL
ncbi:MAG: hypothetical protein JEY71_14335 [Sphaerochaeta sp.]|nr:hypothetical protein [Sphaerochaeta sp.]